MIFGKAVCLMYHELELPGRGLCQSETGYVRYIVSIEDFRRQLQSLREANLPGISVTQMLSGQRGVALTFDDGCETDLLAAAPLLQEFGYCATFYITTGFSGKLGYLTHDQVRTLGSYGFDIGCHSITHPYLTDLDEAGLRREIAEAKESLEDIASVKVDHFSCPGGRWDRRVAEVARNAGYGSVATSRTGTNSSSTDPFCLARIAVMRGTPIADFQRMVAGRGLWPIQMREAMRSAVRNVMGNAVYDKLRSLLLKDA
jgi:peptidoglycan/xylan/chitin deacetylase (PgdA/CDA1 family)